MRGCAMGRDAGRVEKLGLAAGLRRGVGPGRGAGFLVELEGGGGS